MDTYEPRIERGALQVFESFEEAEAADLDFWRARTPEERLAALEVIRQLAYGYDPHTQPLSGVLETVEQPWG